MNGRPWTDADLALLKEKYADTLTADLMQLLQRSERSIYAQAKLHGLRKSEAYLNKYVYTMDAEIGRASRFKPGHATHNKGQKMPPEVYAVAAKTMFKPGIVPHNTKCDGATTVRTDKNGTKRPYIRVSLGVWVEMKNHVWQQAYGPVPKGMCVVVLDGNPFNHTLENLACITKRENMARNTIHNYPEEIKATIKTITKLKTKIQYETSTINRTSDSGQIIIRANLRDSIDFYLHTR